ncbi:MAG: outer membrane beta-barrel protein, partial [Calditrichaceae bacterium]
MRSVFFIIMIFLCSAIFGQDESKTSIAGGAKALIFEFDGLDNLSADSYQGGLGGKMFFNNTMALRVMFNFDHLSEEMPVNPAGNQSGVNGESSETYFGLGAGMEFHLRNKERVSPYFGAGLGFTTHSSEDKTGVTYIEGTNAYR